ncbi:hypothetical protein C8T65DRAFT_70521 [Cerioporus squamosus]|nr:hypothetical protein C8T65DRAFT_70521 [Cerioporus squamosus]
MPSKHSANHRAQRFIVDSVHDRSHPPLYRGAWAGKASLLSFRGPQWVARPPLTAAWSDAPLALTCALSQGMPAGWAQWPHALTSRIPQKYKNPCWAGVDCSNHQDIPHSLPTRHREATELAPTLQHTTTAHHQTPNMNFQQPRRSNSLSQRFRKLSDTVKNTAMNALAHARRASDVSNPGPSTYRGYRSVSKDDIRYVKPVDDWKRYTYTSRSTDDIAAMQRNAEPHPILRPRPTVEPTHPKSRSRTLMMQYGPGPSRPRPTPSGPLPPLPREASGSRDHLKKKKERAVPVPLPDLKQEANVLGGGYQFPPRSSPRHESMFTPFAAPSSPATSMSAAYPDSPTLGVSHSFGGISASGPAASSRAPRPSPLGISARSPTEGRESVYCSTGTPTVRRQGAIKRTSSSGEANLPLPVQHARHRFDRQEETVTTPRHTSMRPLTAPASHERERPVPTLHRVTQRLPPPPPFRPSELPRDPKGKLPEVKPKARHVPRDVEETRSQTDSLVGTETPRSSLMLIPPAPVATTSMVAKVQGTMSMRMRESAGARPVQVSAGGGPALHRAKSLKADVQMEVASQRSLLDSPEGAVLEMKGGRKGNADLNAERRAGVAAWVDSIAGPTGMRAAAAPRSPNAPVTGTRPLNIRKKNGV